LYDDGVIALGGCDDETIVVVVVIVVVVIVAVGATIVHGVVVRVIVTSSRCWCWIHVGFDSAPAHTGRIS
jgi:hypothetical protein